MRICLVLEGCYPYVHGGVSTWMHGYITAMPEHEFVLWVIGAHAEDRGKFVYDLPATSSRCTRCSWTMPCVFRASRRKSTSTTASARPCAVWSRSPIRTGTCCSTFSSAATCIRSHFCRAARLWTSSATCVWPSTRIRLSPTLPHHAFDVAARALSAGQRGSGGRRVSRHLDRLRRSARKFGLQHE